MYHCLEHYFKCTSNNTCIPDMKKCDGTKDCRNGEDELDCGKNFAKLLCHASTKDAQVSKGMTLCVCVCVCVCARARVRAWVGG
jgi:hypothetical protein